MTVSNLQTARINAKALRNVLISGLRRRGVSDVDLGQLFGIDPSSARRIAREVGPVPAEALDLARHVPDSTPEGEPCK